MYFEYQGIKNSQRISGSLFAPNATQAAALLILKDVHPTKISRKKITPLKLKILLSWTEQLASLLDAGFPLLSALGCMQANSSSSFRLLNQRLQQSLEEGFSLTDALRKEPTFDALYVGLIQVGEETGTIAQRLHDLAAFLQQKLSTQNILYRSLTYPLLLLMMSMGLVFVLLTFVLPEFNALYVELGKPLPYFNRWLNAIAENLPMIMIMALAIPFLVFLLVKHTRSSLIQKLPFWRSYQEYRCCQTMSIALGAGVALIPAMQLVAYTTSRAWQHRAWVKAQELIREGRPLHHALEQSQLFSKLSLQRIELAEATGKLTDGFAQLRVLHENNITNLLKRLERWIEPSLMILMGVLVGVMVICLYWPIMRLTTV